jgi:hypothetical protein
MRYSKGLLYRSYAHLNLQVTCDVLSKFGDIFWSASAMAKMTKETLKEMDRIVSALEGPE